jgi:DNA repair exonuclease SbcCD ATPase subunit
MRLDRLILKDFLTFADLDYEFDPNPLLVIGENLTDDAQKNNGSGKSSMFAGIEYAMTASNSRGVRDTDIVTYGSDQSVVQLYASCDIRKERIHIHTTIRLKGSNTTEVSIQRYDSDDWLLSTLSNLDDKKKFIVDWFGISKDDLFNYYIISEARFKSFFKSSNKEKIDLINRFSDAKIIDGVENIDTSELQEEFDGINSAIERIEGKIELTIENIEKENSRDFETELEEAKEKVKDTIEEYNDDLESITDEIESHNNNINRLKDRYPKVDGLIATEKKDRDSVYTKTAELSDNIDKVKLSLSVAQSKLDNFTRTDFDDKRDNLLDHKANTKTDLKIENTDFESNVEKLIQLKKFLQGIEVTLSGSINCPKCKHEFVLEGDIDELKKKYKTGEGLQVNLNTKIDAINDNIKEIKDTLYEIEEKVGELNDKEKEENDSYQHIMDQFNSINEVLNDLKEESLKYETKIKNHNDEITELKNSKITIKQDIKEIDTEIKGLKAEYALIEKQIIDVQNSIKALKLGNNNSTIKGFKAELSILKADKEARKISLDEVGDKIYNLKKWGSNFKLFRMYLANKSLETISYHMNRYLEGMSSDMRVAIDGYRVLANGTFKEEITAKVIRGHERPFASFSGGEQARLLFASILANRHMINESNPYGGLDFLSIDEILDKSDSLGLKSLMQSAQSLEMPVMIISHVSEEELSGVNKIIIVKDNGISTIK